MRNRSRFRDLMSDADAQAEAIDTGTMTARMRPSIERRTAESEVPIGVMMNAVCGSRSGGSGSVMRGLTGMPRSRIPGLGQSTHGRGAPHSHGTMCGARSPRRTAVAS